MKLTPWYPGHIKPVRVGVYQRNYGDHLGIWFCLWTGSRWMAFCSSPARALKESWQSDHQRLPWRGVAK